MSNGFLGQKLPTRKPRLGPTSLESSFRAYRANEPGSTWRPEARPLSESQAPSGSGAAAIPAPPPSVYPDPRRSHQHEPGSKAEKLHELADSAEDLDLIVKAIMDVVEAIAALILQFGVLPGLVSADPAAYPEYGRTLVHALIDYTGKRGLHEKGGSPFGLDLANVPKVIQDQKLRGMNTELEKQIAVSAYLLAKAHEDVTKDFEVAGNTLGDVIIGPPKSMKVKEDKKTGKAKVSGKMASPVSQMIFAMLSKQLTSGRQMMAALALMHYLSPDLSYFQNSGRVDELAASVKKGAELARAGGRGSGPLLFLAGLLPSQDPGSRAVTLTAPV